jgi:hypothetical protein
VTRARGSLAKCFAEGIGSVGEEVEGEGGLTRHDVVVSRSGGLMLKDLRRGVVQEAPGVLELEEEAGYVCFSQESQLIKRPRRAGRTRRETGRHVLVPKLETSPS